MPGEQRRYGLLLPHFGEHASRETLLKFAQTAERYGFDSVWVRDHIVFHPHGMEGQDRTHIDPMITLAMVAGATDSLMLGTGSLIPHRHPIHMALLLSSLEAVAGPGRVIAGWGIGTFDHEFNAVGLGGIPRQELLEEHVAIIRKLWSGEEVGYEGKYYTFNDVDIHPSPASPGSIPIWYCGNSAASARRAVEYCDGWMPGRINMPTFHKRISRLRRLAGEAGKAVPTAGAIPIVSPARTHEEALAKVNWQGMLKSAAKGDWELPASGAWSTPEDLEGALIFGTPEEIIAGTRTFQDGGLDHLVYDLRFRFDEWEECMAILGEEVLPELRRGDADPVRNAAAAVVAGVH